MLWFFSVSSSLVGGIWGSTLTYIVMRLNPNDGHKRQKHSAFGLIASQHFKNLVLTFCRHPAGRLRRLSLLKKVKSNYTHKELNCFLMASYLSSIQAIRNIFMSATVCAAAFAAACS